MTDWNALVRSRLGPLSVDPAREADIVHELAQHVAEHYADLVASGMDEAAAVAAALAPFTGSPANGGRGRNVAADIAKADRPRRSAAPVPPAGRGTLLADLTRDIRYA